MSEYKQCPNGHYYQGDQCPYCKSTEMGNSNTSTKTVPFDDQSPTLPTDDQIGTSNRNAPQNIKVYPPRNVSKPRGTVTEFVEEVVSVSEDGSKNIQIVPRERKLVGWLVSYTLHSLGVDFKLYEGRNIIGRDMDCNITVDDSMVSAKHAVLLYRAGKYSITDSQSTHGTFVNDKDIDLEPCYLQDGDIIKMGQTTFKFRSSF